MVCMSEPAGLRARKKVDTARRIETAALDLFERDGFDRTTVEAIAAAADISPRTFFHYFATKEDVVLADYSERLERVTRNLESQPPRTPPWKALAAAFAASASDYEAEQDAIVRRFRIMFAAPTVFARSLQLQAGWEDAVAAVLAERMGSADGALEPRLLAATALAAMRSAMRHWLATGATASLPDLVATCFGRLGRGLGKL